MKAVVKHYDEDGTPLKLSEELSAHIAWNEKPPIISLEIPITPGVFMGVHIPVFEVELEIKKLRAGGRL